MRGDQIRNLIVECDFCLQYVEPRDRSGLEPILLVLQLALQEMYRLFLYTNQRLINYNLIELCFHYRDDLVKCIAEREVGAVSLKEGTTNRRPGCSIKNQLRSKDADAVGYIAQLSIRDSWFRRWAGHCLGIPDLRGG